MTEKIKEALEYVKTMKELKEKGIMINGRPIDIEEAKNDAANIFSKSYSEYMRIWEAVKEA